ncbi:MAG: sulfotransferase family 2 domain-containing protein [Lysobacterales bacterium]
MRDENKRMNDGPGLKYFVSKLLHIKPTPLRQGINGPYIFIHINKTAGTSIGNAIGLPVKHHQTAREIIASIGREKWTAAYKFTLVRNPWDKVVSHYEYRLKRNKTEIAARNISFSEWVIKTYGPDKDPFYYNNPKAFQPQVEWLKDDEGKISIDFIGRFESINEDFDQIKSVIGLEAELPHLNASKRAGYQSYYDDESREIVADWFREDIELFGYCF